MKNTLKKTLALLSAVCMLVCCTAFAANDSKLAGSWYCGDVSPLRDGILDSLEGMDELSAMRPYMEVTGSAIFDFRQNGVCIMDADVTISLPGVVENIKHITRAYAWQTSGSSLTLDKDVFYYTLNNINLTLRNNASTLSLIQAYPVDFCSAYGHCWAEATYTDPMTCIRCGVTEGEPLAPAAPEYLMVTNWKGVNVRAGQSGNTERYGHLNQGDIVKWSGDFRYASDAWVQIDYNGRTAYVNTNTTTMPFVVRFSDYYGSGRKITVMSGSNLHILPDSSTRKSNIVDTLTGERQFTCIGEVESNNNTGKYYVVRYDFKYTADDGNRYTIQYAFVRQADVKR